MAFRQVETAVRHTYESDRAQLIFYTFSDSLGASFHGFRMPTLVARRPFQCVRVRFLQHLHASGNIKHQLLLEADMSGGKDVQFKPMDALAF